MGTWFTRTRKHQAAIGQMAAEVRRAAARLDDYDRQHGEVTFDVTADDRTTVVEFNAYGETVPRPRLTDAARDRVTAQAATERDVNPEQIHWLSWGPARTGTITAHFIARTDDEQLYQQMRAAIDVDAGSVTLVADTERLLDTVERATHDRDLVAQAQQVRDDATDVERRASKARQDLDPVRSKYHATYEGPLALLYKELKELHEERVRHEQALACARQLDDARAQPLVALIEATRGDEEPPTAEELRDAVRDTVDVDRDTDTVVDRHTRRWIGRDADADTLVEVTDKVAAILNGDDEDGTETRQTGFLRSIREAV